MSSTTRRPHTNSTEVIRNIVTARRMHLPGSHNVPSTAQDHAKMGVQHAASVDDGEFLDQPSGNLRR